MNSKSALSWLALCGVVMCGVACGGENAAGDGSASDSALASQDEALHHHRHASAPATTASTSATPVASASATTTSTAAPVGDVASVIAAAQTPDGMAIPQAAGPGGQCPPVLVALGFWACPILDQTCSFDANGGAHTCVCDRTQGEGQTPSWVCN